MQPDAAQMRAAVKSGSAMPGVGGSPGRFPIRNRGDLQNAIRAVGRAKGDHDVVRRFVMRRAQALGLSSLIPANWAPDGSMRS